MNLLTTPALLALASATLLGFAPDDGSASPTPEPSPLPTVTVVTPTEPTVNDPISCDSKTTVTLPQEVGVKYTEKTIDGKIAVTATPYPNYEFSPNATTQWTYEVQQKDCSAPEPSIIIVTQPPTTPSDTTTSEPAPTASDSASSDNDEGGTSETNTDQQTPETSPDTNQPQEDEQKQKSRKIALLVAGISSTLAVIFTGILMYIHRASIGRFLYNIISVK